MPADRLPIWLAAYPFIIEPLSSLGPRETARLRRFSTNGLAWQENDALRSIDSISSDFPSFRLSVVDTFPKDNAYPSSYSDDAPAAVVAASGKIRVTQRRFVAEIDPERREGRLYRQSTDGPGLEATLRVALCALLPGDGGLPLHAAGIVMGDHGIAFFGPSGAGKSTLSASCPWPVLSDELVAVVGQPPMLLATGFWGTNENRDNPLGPVPLLAAVELAKAPRCSLERLTPSEAFRRMIQSTLVPGDPKLWGKTLAVIGRLVRSVPSFRMAWNPAAPRWEELRNRLEHEWRSR